MKMNSIPSSTYYDLNSYYNRTGTNVMGTYLHEIVKAFTLLPNIIKDNPQKGSFNQNKTRMRAIL